MSQQPYFHSPYVPPTADPRYWQPTYSGRGPAATAGILQMILGGLTLLWGTCIGTLLLANGVDVILAEIQKSGMQLPQVPGENLSDVLRVFFVLFTSAAMLIGMTLLVLAVFVRQGKKPAIITSIIIVGLVSLVLLVEVIAGILWMYPSVVIVAGALILTLAILRKLFQALRSWPDPQTAAAMQQAWMWMMQQQSAAGYGYGYGPEQVYPPLPPQLPSDQSPPEKPSNGPA